MSLKNVKHDCYGLTSFIFGEKLLAVLTHSIMCSALLGRHKSLRYNGLEDANIPI